MKKINHISDLSARYLAGEMTPAREKRFLAMIDRDEERKKEFLRMKETWERVEAARPGRFSYTGSAWDSLHGRLEKENLLEPQEKQLYLFSRSFMRIAASILIFLALSVPAWFLISRSEGPEGISYTAVTSTSSYDLPDGSRVFLKKGSGISLSEGFENQRSLSLKGEAYFDIMADPDHPFTITTHTATVKVLGTSFNVKESDDNGTTEVLVESGRVSIAPLKKEEEIELRPGQFGQVSKSRAGLASRPDLNYLAWKTREFEFRNQRVSDVLRVLEDAYQVNIEFEEEEIGDLRLTSAYSKQSLDAVLKTIGTALSLEIIHKDKHYEIRKK